MIHTKSDSGGHRFVIHGLPGVGKTHLAAGTGRSIFVPAEMGLRNLPTEVPYTDQPSTFEELLTVTREAADFAQANGLKHVVTDSLTAVERLVYVAAQQSTGKAFADAIDYSKLWRAATPFWSRWLDALERIRLTGLHVWIIAHSSEEMTADLDTGKQWRRATLALNGPKDAVAGTISQIVAWADHVLYLVQDLQVHQVKGSIATARVMARELWTCDVGGAVAKNRAGLPPKLVGSWAALSAALAAGQATRTRAPAAQPAEEQQPATAVAEPSTEPAPMGMDDEAPDEAPVEQPKPAERSKPVLMSFAERLAGADVGLAGMLALDAASRGCVEDLTAAYIRALSIASSQGELEAIAKSCKAEPLFATLAKSRPQACADAFLRRQSELRKAA